MNNQREKIKLKFKNELSDFIKEMKDYISKDNQWVIKGFIDIHKNIFTITTDTKIVSKILEIHLLPRISYFADSKNYELILAKEQNYYPDMTFQHKIDKEIMFAVDFKTTYRKPENNDFCNGFTLGSHGAYFIERDKKKNIQFPYNNYWGHFCFGIIYSRNDDDKISELVKYDFTNLEKIPSVAKNFELFIAEKWKIASDKSGSGNTANIGSTKKISDILSEKGIFTQYKNGESMFDEYWQNYGKEFWINTGSDNKKKIKITSLKIYEEYIEHLKSFDKFAR